MKDVVSILTLVLVAYTAWTNYQTARINREIQRLKMQEDEAKKKEKVAEPADTGSDQ